MDKINQIILLYSKNRLTFKFISQLIEISDLLLTDEETKKLIKFFDKEFEKMYN